mgnify:CR=1 FL=1
MTKSPATRRLPPWLRVSYRGGGAREEVRSLLRSLNLHTVCQSAQCPNLCQCWQRGTATFMILGDSCTRDCRFCAVPHTPPAPPESDEPERVAEAAARLELNYVVVTSVTRDDLPDGGANHFARTVRAIKARRPGAGIEVLTPDFNGDSAALKNVLDAGPTVFNHNLETCERLTNEIRSGADYRRSLGVLRAAADHVQASERAFPFIKSGIMLGMGETRSEIHGMLRDLYGNGVRLLTVGQYLPPSKSHWSLDRYVHPDEFEEWGRIAREMYGFTYVASAPLVRSSYMAEEGARTVQQHACPGSGAADSSYTSTPRHGD